MIFEKEINSRVAVSDFPAVGVRWAQTDLEYRVCPFRGYPGCFVPSKTICMSVRSHGGGGGGEQPPPAGPSDRKCVFRPVGDSCPRLCLSVPFPSLLSLSFPAFTTDPPLLLDLPSLDFRGKRAEVKVTSRVRGGGCREK